MTKTITTVLGAIAMLSAAPSAFAAVSGDAVTFKVSTAGLDLRTPRDARNMLRRIETAAAGVCGAAPYIGDLSASRQWQTCVSHNVSRAVTQLGSPLVSEASGQALSAQTASIGR